MSYFKAKMHQIRFQLGLSPRGLTINRTWPHRAVPDRIWLTRPYPYYDKLQE